MKSVFLKTPLNLNQTLCRVQHEIGHHEKLDELLWPQNENSPLMDEKSQKDAKDQRLQKGKVA